MSNPIALVTGVSRLQGIGRAICLELANRGFDIFFTYWSAYDKTMPWSIDPSEPSEILKEIEATGVQCASLEINLAMDGAVDELMDAAIDQLGIPTVLINNATYSTQTSIDDFDVSELDRHYAVNVRATTLLIAKFVKRYNGNHYDRIINISSGQALGPMPDELAYAMTKGAMNTLTKTLYQDLATKGITINSANPGPTDTGWMNEEVAALVLERCPMGRVGLPKDAARLVGFLCSEEGGWITGQVINSEGGFMR